MEKFQGKLVKISDDASSRKFYRLKNKKKTSIIVKAKKEKFKNLIVYSAINKFLKKNKILAPQLLKRFFKHGVIEIDDFGNILFERLSLFAFPITAFLVTSPMI